MARAVAGNVAGGSGRVLSVNISGGGLPKLPVARARVTWLGVDGDRQASRTIHGGPHRAVCLYAIEAIERLQSEGHPIEPGSAGENLTTSGVEWSLLPVGTRARIGESLLLELSGPTNPCAKQVRNFSDGRFSRISIELHPSDSRMYARVLEEGEVGVGDDIEILPPAADSLATDERLLARLDRAVARADLATWRAAREAGHDVRIIDDGELVMAAAPALPGPALNCAFGLARMPQLVDDVIQFYDANRAAGWLAAESAPWSGAEPDVVVDVFSRRISGEAGAAADDARVELPDVPGLVVRRIGPSDLAPWEEVRRLSGGSGIEGRRKRNAWTGIRARLLEAPHVFIVLAELDGRPVGSGVLTIAGGVGWLRGGVVVPKARGRGIQRALIAARGRLAAEAGCDVLGSWAEPDGASARNLERSGFRRIGTRRQYRYVPAGGR